MADDKLEIDGLKDLDKEFKGLTTTVEVFVNELIKLSGVVKEISSVNANSVKSQVDVNVLYVKSKEATKDLVDAEQKLLDAQAALAIKQKEILTQKQEEKKSRDDAKKGIEAEENSINKLKEANKNLLIARNNINTATKEGQSQISKINKEIDDNNKKIAENSSALEKQKINIGNYGSAIDKLIPGFGGVVEGIQSMIKASLAFIATPIGAVIAAVAVAILAVKEAFTSSEAGQDRWTKIMDVIGTVLKGIMDVLSEIGNVIIDAFSSPVETLKSFGNLIKEQVVNRVVGLIELLPELGKAIWSAFKGDFKEAGRIAADALLKVGTGVDHALEKTDALIKKGKEWAEQQLKNAEISAKIAEMRDEADDKEREDIELKAKSEARIAELRLKAREKDKYSIKDRMAFMKEAYNLEDELEKNALDIAKLRQNAEILEFSLSKFHTEEKLIEQKNLNAAVYKIEAERDAAKKGLLREMTKLEKEAKQQEKENIDNEIAWNKEMTDNDIKNRKEVNDVGATLMKNELDRNKQLADDKLKQLNDIDAAINETYLNEVDAANSAYNEKSKTFANNYDTEIAYISELHIAKQNFLDAELTNEKAKYEAGITSQKEYNAKIFALTKQKADDNNNYEDTVEDKKREKTLKYLSFTKQGLAEVSNFGNMLYARELQELDKSYKYKIDKAKKSGKDTTKLEEQYAKEKSEIQRKQAIFDKILKVAQAGIDIASAIVAALKTPWMVPIIAAIGAIQMAAIIGTPIPEYWKGGKNLSGLAIVGDRYGEEIIKTSDGRMYETPNVSTPVVLPNGSEVINHWDTLKIKKDSQLNIEPLIAEQRATRKAISSRPTQIWTPNALVELNSESNSRKYYTDKYFRS